jgi:hypothetical protein
VNNMEYLEMLASGYIDQYEQLPLDLVMKMSAEGMDVVAIEKQLINERDMNNGQ